MRREKIVVVEHLKDEFCRSYTLLFRNGIIEAVDLGILSPYMNELILPAQYMEEHILSSFTRYLKFCEEQSISLPIVVFITIINAKGYKIDVSGLRIRVNGIEVDRDILILPELIIEDYSELPATLFKPIFDSIWNACGYPRSFCYDENGVRFPANF